jgi:hypothetical protein
MLLAAEMEVLVQAGVVVLSLSFLLKDLRPIVLLRM